MYFIFKVKTRMEFNIHLEVHSLQHLDFLEKVLKNNLKNLQTQVKKNFSMENKAQ